jgi:hypothetical protein
MWLFVTHRIPKAQGNTLLHHLSPTPRISFFQPTISAALTLLHAIPNPSTRNSGSSTHQGDGQVVICSRGHWGKQQNAGPQSFNLTCSLGHVFWSVWRRILAYLGLDGAQIPKPCGYPEFVFEHGSKTGVGKTSMKGWPPGWQCPNGVQSIS